MQLGWIKRSVGGLLEGRKTGSAEYHIEQDGFHFVIEDKSKDVATSLTPTARCSSTSLVLVDRTRV